MYYPRYKKRDKVPILSGEEINNIAERFLLDFNRNLLDKPQAIDVESFLEFYLNVIMDFNDLTCDERILGMTVFNDTNKVPVYDSLSNAAKYISAKAGTVIIDNSLLTKGQEHRLSFTLGNEAGHWIFHQDYFGYFPGQLSLFENDIPFIRCREVNSNYLYKRTDFWDDEKWLEWQADKFSASILMPESLMKNIMSDYQNISRDDQKIVDAVERVSDVFEVSKQASYYRLCDLGYISTRNKSDVSRQLSLFDYVDNNKG